MKFVLNNMNNWEKELEEIMYQHIYPNRIRLLKEFIRLNFIEKSRVEGMINENNKEAEALDGYIMNEDWNAISRGWGHEITQKDGELKYAKTRINELSVKNSALSDILALLDKEKKSCSTLVQK